MIALFQLWLFQFLNRQFQFLCNIESCNARQIQLNDMKFLMHSKLSEWTSFTKVLISYKIIKYINVIERFVSDDLRILNLSWCKSKNSYLVFCKWNFKLNFYSIDSRRLCCCSILKNIIREEFDLLAHAAFRKFIHCSIHYVALKIIALIASVFVSV